MNGSAAACDDSMNGSEARGQLRRQPAAQEEPCLSGKYCPVCRTHKSAEDFHRDPSNADMLHSCCRLCKRERKRNNRQMAKDAKRLLEMTGQLAGGPEWPQQQQQQQPQQLQHFGLAQGLAAAPHQMQAPCSAAQSLEQALLLLLPWNPSTPQQQGWQLPRDSSVAGHQSGSVAASHTQAVAGAPSAHAHPQYKTGRCKRGGRKGPPPTAEDSAKRARVFDSFRQAAQQSPQRPAQQVYPANLYAPHAQHLLWGSLPATDNVSLAGAMARIQPPFEVAASRASAHQTRPAVPAQLNAAAQGLGHGILSASELLRLALRHPEHRSTPAPAAGHTGLQAALVAACAREQPAAGVGALLGSPAMSVNEAPAPRAAVMRGGGSSGARSPACSQCGLGKPSLAGNGSLHGSVGPCKLCIMASVLSESKYCGSCYEVKERHGFDEDVSASDGLQEYCRECMHVPGEDMYRMQQGTAAPALHKAHGRKSEPGWQQRSGAKRPKVEDVSSSLTKQCGRCGERKGAAGFQPDLATFDGLAPVCRCCAAQAWGPPRRAAVGLSGHAPHGRLPLPARRTHAPPAPTVAEEAARISQHNGSGSALAVRRGLMLLLTELMVAVVPWLASRTGGAPAFCALTAPQQLGAGLLLTHLIVLLHPRAKPGSA